MFIEKIEISNYRNILESTNTFSNKINIIIGNNGQGKTNFLESIYVCLIGRSFRSSLDNDLINFNSQTAKINTFVNKNMTTDKISLFLSKDSKSKMYFLNSSQIKKLGDLLGTTYIVSFTPENLNLIKSGPQERRRFLDMELCQLSEKYYYELKNYNHLLKQRNSLLKKLKYDKSLMDTVFIWDDKIVESGSKIMDFRDDFINNINNYSSKIHLKISNNKENLEISYKRNVEKNDFLSKLKKNIDRDIIYGATSRGIHKDDISFSINNRDVKTFGSQGQQRCASLSAKLAEIKIIEKLKNKKPILLLDDVFSELDRERQQLLLENIRDTQVFITATGIEDVLINITNESDTYVFKCINGNFTKI